MFLKKKQSLSWDFVSSIMLRWPPRCWKKVFFFFFNKVSIGPWSSLFYKSNMHLWHERVTFCGVWKIHTGGLLCVCVSVRVCVCVCACVKVCVSVCMCVYDWSIHVVYSVCSLGTPAQRRQFICMYIYLHICIHTCVCIYVYTIHICIYIYLYLYM